MMVNPPPSTNEEMNHHNAYSRNLTTPPPSGRSLVLKHNTGVLLQWTPEEDQILLDRLDSYPVSLARYVEVADIFSTKGVRDVAIRWKWICKKGNAKRRKKDHHNGLGRAPCRVYNEEISDTVVPPSSQQFEPSENGNTNELTEQNWQWLDQISANFITPRGFMDNRELFNKIRKNINTLLANLNENMSETMKRMPKLPEKLNEELLIEMFPTSNLPPL